MSNLEALEMTPVLLYYGRWKVANDKLDFVAI